MSKKKEGKVENKALEFVPQNYGSQPPSDFSLGKVFGVAVGAVGVGLACYAVGRGSVKQDKDNVKITSLKRTVKNAGGEESIDYVSYEGNASHYARHHDFRVGYESLVTGDSGYDSE